MELIQKAYDENYSCYGARKIWLALRQDDHDVARCTVERLMRVLGLRGASRGKVKRTTIADPAAARAGDLVGRNFAPPAPNLLWVADFTYISTLAGWVYVAFVIDAYARRILGWKASSSMTAELVLAAVARPYLRGNATESIVSRDLYITMTQGASIRRCGSLNGSPGKE